MIEELKPAHVGHVVRTVAAVGSRGQMARLMVADGSAFELAGGEMLVGRGERELDDPPKINVGPLRGSLTVSRRHARLREHVGRWYLQAERPLDQPDPGRRLRRAEGAPRCRSTTAATSSSARSP